MHIFYNLLHIAKPPRRKVVQLIPSVRDGLILPPLLSIQFSISTLDGWNTSRFYILHFSDCKWCRTFISYVYESFAFLLLGIVLKMDSQVPNAQTVKQKAIQEIRKCAVPAARASAHVFWRWKHWTGFSLFPLIMLVLIIFSPVISLYSLHVSSLGLLQDFIAPAVVMSWNLKLCEEESDKRD